MQFLLTTDFDGIIGGSTFTQLRGTADADLDKAEELALSELDPLYSNFDIPGELIKTGTSRSALLVRLCVHITAYYLFNKVEDDDIPQRIIDNYLQALKDIRDIATGKLSSTLGTITSDDTGLPKSNYRWGSDTARDNEIF